MASSYSAGVQDLVEAARQQGWTIESGGSTSGHTIRFRNPRTGRHLNVDRDAQGGELTASRGNLKRIGLVVPELRGRSTKAKHVTVASNGRVEIEDAADGQRYDVNENLESTTDQDAPTSDDFAALLGMIEELADQFKTYRDADIEAIVELRGKVVVQERSLADASRKIVALEKAASELLKEADGLQRRLKAIEQKPAERIDPLERFRERLK